MKKNNLNIDDMSDKVKEACDVLAILGGVKHANSKDWKEFTNKIDEELARAEAHNAEIKAAIDELDKIAGRSNN